MHFSTLTKPSISQSDYHQGSPVKTCPTYLIKLHVLYNMNKLLLLFHFWYLFIFYSRFINYSVRLAFWRIQWNFSNIFSAYKWLLIYEIWKNSYYPKWLFCLRACLCVFMDLFILFKFESMLWGSLPHLSSKKLQ